MIRLADARIGEEAIAAVGDVLRSGHLVAGEQCAEFERELAGILDSRHVVATSSGTAALHLALLVHGIGPGNAVLVPDFTFPATANVVAACGARPILVDVDPGTYNISIASLERALLEFAGPEQMRAVIPVHQFGLCADMVEINAVARANGLAVIEDAACALGSTLSDHPAGTLADLACFSFHPRKTITTGEGGAVCTNDSALADRLRRLRNHGMERTSHGTKFVQIGLNYRLTEFQSVLGRHQLKTLDGSLRTRRAVATTYNHELRGLCGNGVASLPTADEGHSWQTYMIVLESAVDRNAVINALSNDGVESNAGAQSLATTGLYPRGPVDPSVGRQLGARGLALPCHQSLTEADVQRVCVALSRSLGY